MKKILPTAFVIGSQRQRSVPKGGLVFALAFHELVVRSASATNKRIVRRTCNGPFLRIDCPLAWRRWNRYPPWAFREDDKAIHFRHHPCPGSNDGRASHASVSIRSPGGAKFENAVD